MQGNSPRPKFGNPLFPLLGSSENEVFCSASHHQHHRSLLSLTILPSTSLSSPGPGLDPSFGIPSKDYDVYVTGHSLGGFIAEAAASYCDAPGAVWNCPGPVAVGKWKQLVGPFRPNFEAATGIGRLGVSKFGPFFLGFKGKPKTGSAENPQNCEFEQGNWWTLGMTTFLGAKR